ncbi:cytochrome P450 71A22-like [Chenopodium quinoa]|uniref:cytochrome P450 71A22-like n=1 Tax=Chenopodium quinoa TaxID=63459 RepID=UPI000B7751BD|nr:cytochrome P450 71A22-like [Chenopodium quinoa]
MIMALIHFLEKLPIINSLSLILLLSFLIILYKWIYSTNYNHANNKLNKPPYPPKLPILGNLHQLGKLPHHSLRSLSRQYGDLMLLHIGSKATIVASSAGTAREIMKTHDIVFANRPSLKVARKIMYDGKGIAFASYGEYWRQMKSMCVLHMLSNTKVRSFRRVREEEAQVIVKKISNMRLLQEEVNLSDVLIGLTNDVICRTAFGRKYTGEKGCENIKELLGDFSEALGTFCMEDFVPWLSWIDCLRGVNRKADKVAFVLDEFIEKIVQEHIDRQNLQTDETDEGDKGEKLQDFVDILLEIQRENSTVLPKESVKAILLDMLSAATDTTYTLLEWAMAELLKHPQAMKQLQDEVRECISRSGKKRVDEDEVKNMKYLKAVIKETLRLHPPLPLLVFRESSQDVKVNGYDIAAGTQVIINAWTIQRDSASWDEPEEFLPERFLNSSVDFRGQDFEFIPFGAGRRSCPGISFGIVDAELVLATLAYEFDWKLREGYAFNLFEGLGVTIRKRDPIVVIPIPYSSKY